MEESNAVHNPIVPGFKMVKDENGIEVDATFSKQIVGSLMYLTATWPDMMFVVSLISRYMAQPTELHLLAAKKSLEVSERDYKLWDILQEGREQGIGCKH